MPIHTLQTIPHEPEETPFSGLLQGLAICLLSLTFENYVRTRAYADVFARMLGMNGRALFERYNRLDVALYRNATQIWCAEWYKAIGDRESCVRTYAHAHPGTPSPCHAVAAMA